MRFGPKARPPQWWPEGESFPPPSAGPAWSEIKRGAVRVVVVGVALFLALPAAVALLLTNRVGGSAAVTIVVVFWVSAFLVLLIGGRVAVRSFKPIRGFIDTTGRLAEGDYGARVQEEGPRAFRPVIHSLNVMAERLEASDVLRQQLLADVGHELRTPLTVIRASLEAMADGVRVIDHNEVNALLGDIHVMERLLDDLRTLSSAEAGVLKLHKEWFDLVHLSTDTAAGFEPRARNASVSISVRPDPLSRDPIEVNADPVRIKEVLNNLIANALRATPAGGSITIEVKRSSTRDVVITVSDDGIGMSDDERAHAFERFHKGPTSDGSGLGLTISKDLVEAHGGCIEIESQPEHGTTVTVQLPS